MSKEQLLVYSYYSCGAPNIIHYSCKCVQQVHMIPYNFVHIEYKLIRTKSVKDKETEGNGPSDVIYHG